MFSCGLVLCGKTRFIVCLCVCLLYAIFHTILICHKFCLQHLSLRNKAHTLHLILVLSPTFFSYLVVLFKTRGAVKLPWIPNNTNTNYKNRTEPFSFWHHHSDMAKARTVGVAVDFSPTSKLALRWAVDNLINKGDQIILITVQPPQAHHTRKELFEDTGSRWCLLSLSYVSYAYIYIYIVIDKT